MVSAHGLSPVESRDANAIRALNCLPMAWIPGKATHAPHPLAKLTTMSMTQGRSPNVEEIGRLARLPREIPDSPGCPTVRCRCAQPHAPARCTIFFHRDTLEIDRVCLMPDRRLIRFLFRYGDFFGGEWIFGWTLWFFA